MGQQVNVRGQGSIEFIPLLQPAGQLTPEVHLLQRSFLLHRQPPQDIAATSDLIHQVVHYLVPTARRQRRFGSRRHGRFGGVGRFWGCRSIFFSLAVGAVVVIVVVVVSVESVVTIFSVVVVVVVILRPDDSE